VRLRLSNGRIEAMTSTVRLLSHRSRGFRRRDNPIALIHVMHDEPQSDGEPRSTWTPAFGEAS
jgi:hypothetical protein